VLSYTVRRVRYWWWLKPVGVERDRSRDERAGDRRGLQPRTPLQ